jgi:hypothetical protein
MMAEDDPGERSAVRRIEILDNLYLQFSGRDDAFDLGLEVGALTVLMAEGSPVIERCVSHDCVEQLRPIAERFRYGLVATESDAGMMQISLHNRASGRPRLRLV